MNDEIALSRSILTSEIFRNPRLSQLLLYLLSGASDCGIEITEICCEFGWSKRMAQMLITNLQSIFGDSFSALTAPRSEVCAQAVIADNLPSFADTFNEKVKGTPIPQIRSLSDARKNALKKRAKEYGGMEALVAVLDRVLASDFLSGRKTDFCATFDWIFKKANFIKILEGNYDNKSTSKVRRAPDGRQIDRYSALEAAAGAVIRRNPPVFTTGND